MHCHFMLLSSVDVRAFASCTLLSPSATRLITVSLRGNCESRARRLIAKCLNAKRWRFFLMAH